MVYTLPSGPMVYTLFPCFPKELAHHNFFLLCGLAVGHLTERGGVPRRWSILFIPWSMALHQRRRELAMGVRVSIEGGEHSCDPNHQHFPKRMAIQMGSILRHKWEEYCDTKGRSTESPSFSSQLVGHRRYCNTNRRRIAMQVGGAFSVIPF